MRLFTILRFFALARRAVLALERLATATESRTQLEERAIERQLSRERRTHTSRPVDLGQLDVAEANKRWEAHRFAESMMIDGEEPDA